MLIAIDAGHGGKDPGAVGNGVAEKDIALKLALKAGLYLRTNYDCDVAYTRNRDVFLSLLERANSANKVKADLFCSFHINSAGSTAKGFESYRYPGTKGKTLALQESVHKEVMKVLKTYKIVDRGMKQQNFAVLRETSMPALLTETLFISNPAEAKLLNSEAFLDQVAQAHAIGLAKATGLKKRNNATAQPKKQYYLMTDTFKNKAESEKNAQMLKEKLGWNVYVKET